MDNLKQLQNLSHEIMIESSKVKVLLEKIYENDDNGVEICTLTKIAAESNKKINSLNSRIGLYVGR